MPDLQTFSSLYFFRFWTKTTSVATFMQPIVFHFSFFPSCSLNIAKGKQSYLPWQLEWSVHYTIVESPVAIVTHDGRCVEFALLPRVWDLAPVDVRNGDATVVLSHQVLNLEIEQWKKKKEQLVKWILMRSDTCESGNFRQEFNLVASYSPVVSKIRQNTMNSRLNESKWHSTSGSSISIHTPRGQCQHAVDLYTERQHCMSAADTTLIYAHNFRMLQTFACSCWAYENFCGYNTKEPSGEKRALSPASWFSRNGQPNARPPVNLNMWPPTKKDISWEWEKVFWSGFLHFLQDNFFC